MNKYLGHIVSVGGVGTDPKKLQVVEFFILQALHASTETFASVQPPCSVVLQVDQSLEGMHLSLQE